jgi:hypothetical protein
MPEDGTRHLRATITLLVAAEICVSEGVAIRTKWTQRGIISGRIPILAIASRTIADGIDAVASAFL